MGFLKPPAISLSVVFPLPDSPTMPKTSPSPREKDTLFKATKGSFLPLTLYSFVMFFASRIIERTSHSVSSKLL